MVQNRLKYINTFQGVYKRFHQNVFDPRQIYGRQAVSFDQKLILDFFVSEFKVHRSNVTPESNEINKKQERI